MALPAVAADHRGGPKLDRALQQRAEAPRGTSRVIIRTDNGVPADALITSLRGKPGRRLRLLDAQVAEVPDAALPLLAQGAGVRSVALDRRVWGTMERTGETVGATWVTQTLGFDGTGIGVAIIDSGVAATHDDLTGKVTHFADFVNFQTQQYDDYGHGTHVAGIIAGSGYDSNGARKGIAPGASLVVLKVLDGAGNGYISNVIAALDYAVENRAALNIRVINLSVAAGVFESFESDPLTLAAKRAVEAGIVVVTAAGNIGKNAQGQTQYGGITAPGNAPWVLTVGAASHNGTTDRADDTVAGFSSRGPSFIDYSAKPDLVAPGVGIESLADAGSTLFASKSDSRLWGSVPTPYEPYLSLSGTSMAAPVVSGTVALMLQANPALTPNAVKAILQYTSESRHGFSPLAQGAGFLNTRGAVEFAKTFKAPSADGFVLNGGTLGGGGLDPFFPGSDPLGDLPDDDEAEDDVDDDGPEWSRHIIWGNYRIGGGLLTATSNAWGLDVVWGSATTSAGGRVTWGVECAESDPNCENIVWGTATADENIVWGTAIADSSDENIVWGTNCAPGDDNCENIVWGTAALCDANDSDCENIVWGTVCGGGDCENIVWGTVLACDADASDCENIVWGTAEAAENIVWGTVLLCDAGDSASCENIVWGTAEAAENIVWGTSAIDDVVWGARPRRPRAHGPKRSRK